jgi:hypothetical protein
MILRKYTWTSAAGSGSPGYPALNSPQRHLALREARLVPLDGGFLQFGLAHRLCQGLNKIDYIEH